jgi:hypothetical protein
MINLAISILWLLLGVLVLLGVLWLVFYALANFGITIPEPIKKGIYIVVLILIIIAALSLIAGGGGSLKWGFRHTGLTVTAVAAYPAAPAGHLQKLLT